VTKGRKPSTTVAGTLPVREIPRAPTWLSEDARAEWRRVVPSLVERRVLDTADLASLEHYCVCVGRVREIERIMRATDGIDPALCRAQDKAITTARHLAALFGLTPADRSRPTIRDGVDDDELGFLG
jgi:P27 family predicted phage terminase small subunit